MNDFLKLLPPHKAGLFLEHNVHKNYYNTAKEAIFQQREQEIGPHWKDEEAVQRAIETNEIWTLQWYPETSIGFCQVAAPTLQELLELANSGDFN